MPRALILACAAGGTEGGKAGGGRRALPVNVVAPGTPINTFHQVIAQLVLVA